MTRYVAGALSDTNGHRKVLGILEAGPSARGGNAGRTLLDIPSGQGPVLTGARDAGYDVVEVDLFPREEMRGVVADACAPLPFADESFDWVLSMEGIEHFENQTGFVRECARVLKPGGTLILTTPNILHLNARFSSFFTGQRLLKGGFVNEVTPLRDRSGDRLYHGHAFLVDAFRLRYIMRIVGLELKEVHGTSVSASSIFLAPFLPLIWGLSRYSTWSARRRLMKARRKTPGPAVERQLEGLATSAEILFKKKLIYVAQKPADGAPLTDHSHMLQEA